MSDHHLRVDRPALGHYRTRLRSRGPWVPAMIVQEPPRDPVTFQAMDRPPVLRCYVNGAEVDVDTWWTRLHPISPEEHERLTAETEGLDLDLDLDEQPVRI